MLPSALATRKRKVSEPVASSSTLPLDLIQGSLDLGSDADIDDDDLDADDASVGEEGDPFPELDVGSSDGEAEDRDEGDLADVEEDENEDAEGLDVHSDDDEGYNSSDIEALEAGEPDYSPPSSYTRSASSRRTSRSKSPVSSFIAAHTTKPDERDPSILLRPEDPLQGKMVVSELTGRPKRVYPDIEAGYGSESSTEDAPNRVGDIPDHWYDDLPHIGYDVDGKKVMRPAQGDELDRFLETVEDPDSWTSVQDKLLQQNTNLTDAELDIIRRLQKGENPDENYDPYAPTVEWYTSHEAVMPLSGRAEPKARFVASKWEHKKVMKIVRAIRQGRIIPNKPAATKPQFYAIWSSADSERAPHAMHMPAPAPRLPDDSESYNPPEEHVLEEDERAAYLALEKGDRKRDYMPQKHSSLRVVPAYKDLVQERFERCLDLYLAPRMRKTRLNIDPESLVPKLPSPKELRPFPTMGGVKYAHPAGARVRCVAIDPTGMWLVTGAEDGVVRVWELENGRLAWKMEVGKGPVHGIEWCPDKDVGLVAAVLENKVVLVSPLPLLNPNLALHTTTVALKAVTGASTSAPPKAGDVIWSRGSEVERSRGVLVWIDVLGTPKQVTWHRKGDYFSTVASDGTNKSVLIHQLSKHQTQSPFRKTKGLVQKVAFHPSKPHFFVVTQRYIRLYDLVAQSLIKTLQPGLKWLSSIDIHPMGDNLIVGSYDKKLCWFDMDLSSKPYKTLRYHARAIRSVHYHRSYPLFASSSDDGTINIFHGTVYSDLMQNPLIVPLKVLKGHEVKAGLGVLDIQWHPTLPWLVSAGADGDARLWMP